MSAPEQHSADHEPVEGLGEEIFAVRNLGVAYETNQGHVDAVSDVSLRLRRGEIMAVIGESGSGKSTLARGILGLLPTGGRITGGEVEIRLSEQPVSLVHSAGAVLRSLRGSGIGFVPQATGGALNPVQRVSAHFRVTVKAHGISWEKQGRALAERALAEAGLPATRQVMHAYPHELSGGMAQRVVVALASVLEPSLLIADEPTSALDVTVQRRLLDNLAANVRRTRRGVIIITHDIRIAAHYCDSVLVMYGGYAVESGPVDAVLTAARHPYTRALLVAMPSNRERKRLPVRTGGTGSLSSTSRCPYYAECPARTDPRCAAEVPPFAQVAPDHYVRSFYG